ARSRSVPAVWAMPDRSSEPARSGGGSSTDPRDVLYRGPGDERARPADRGRARRRPATRPVADRGRRRDPSFPRTMVAGPRGRVDRRALAPLPHRDRLWLGGGHADLRRRRDLAALAQGVATGAGLS